MSHDHNMIAADYRGIARQTARRDTVNCCAAQRRCGGLAGQSIDKPDTVLLVGGWVFWCERGLATIGRWH